MRRNAALLLCAVQFLTRLPVPDLKGFQADWINRSAKFFPLVGQLVGVMSAVVLLLAGKIFGGWIAALLAVLAAVLVTGALHEDGLADTADGFFGGHDPTGRLAIMKDSRIGTYGALALGFCTAIKLASLVALPLWVAAVGLVAAHGVARAATVLVMYALPYAGDAGNAKVDISLRPPMRGEVLLALVLCCWPLWFLSGARVVLAVGICAAVTFFVALMAKRLVGGQRGDVLGAIEQLCEAGFLLGCAAKIFA